tara:strand:- start:97 stop:294 length:198 start_codon:yes stop_codon:yes gene_type:complete
MNERTNEARCIIFDMHPPPKIIELIKLANDKTKIIIKNFGNNALKNKLIKGASSFLKTNGATTEV